MAEAVETDYWSNALSSSSSSSSSSRRYQSRSEKYREARVEDEVEEQEPPAEYTCPFCPEDFDIVGLYCHTDEEHPHAVKIGVCPVCTKRVGKEIILHIITQHGNLFKVQRKRRHRKGGSSSICLESRNEPGEENLQSHLGGSLRVLASSLAETDMLLSSFLFSRAADGPTNAKSDSPEESPVSMSGVQPLKSSMNARNSLLPSLDQDEEARKYEFMQGLAFSTIINNDL